MYNMVASRMAEPNGVHGLAWQLEGRVVREITRQLDEADSSRIAPRARLDSSLNPTKAGPSPLFSGHCLNFAEESKSSTVD